MANLADVVQQLRNERVQAQRRVEQLDEALKALSSLDGLRGKVGRVQTPGKTGRTMPVAAHKELLGLSGTLREVKPIAAHKTDPTQFDQGTQQRGFLLTAERLGSDEDARQRLHVRLRSDIYGATTKA